jgi:hypothetical protein
MQKWYMALAKTFDCVFLETRIEKSSGSRPRKTRMDGQDYTWFLVNQPYVDNYYLDNFWITRSKPILMIPPTVSRIIRKRLYNASMWSRPSYSDVIIDSTYMIRLLLDH